MNDEESNPNPPDPEPMPEPSLAIKAPYKPKKRKGARKGRERGAKVREYYARLIAEGKVEQAAAYKQGREWAWQWLRSSTVDAQSLAQSDSQIANDGTKAGEEGVKKGESVESGIDSPHSPNFDTKALLPNELDTKSAIRGVFTKDEDMYIRQLVADMLSEAFKGFKADTRGEGIPEIEEARYFKEEKVPVVWPKDSGETFEVVITGAPPNKGMRLVQREGDAEVYQMWCDRNLWPMVGWRVAARPSDDSERPGLLMVGVYGRSGLRVE